MFGGAVRRVQSTGRASILSRRGEWSPLVRRPPPATPRRAHNSCYQNQVRKISTTPQSLRKTPQRALRIDSKNVGQLLSKYDTWLLDCDGVLWNSDHYTKFVGTSKAVEKLRGESKKLMFVTNNSLHARSAYLEKFRNFAGFEAELEDVFSVAYASVIYLKEIAKIKSKCYLIGTEGMAEELDISGIDYVGFGPDNEHVSTRPEDLLALHHDPEVEAVLVGFDEFFNYSKLTKACSYLHNPKCHYVATNEIERSIVLSDTCRQPLTGALLSAVSTGSGREPVVIGKPYNHLMDCIKSQQPGLDLSRTLMIGDSIKTDIGFAKNTGMDSLLVLAGATTEERFRREEETQGDNIPNYVMGSFTEFGEIL